MVRRDCGGGDTSAVAVEFPSVGGDNTDACINYRGTYVKTKRDTTHPSRDTGVECALVFDPQAGSFRVEKIDAVVKSLRVARDLKTDADGVGVGVGLTGAHGTQCFDEFSYGGSDRGASIRIPWQVARDGKGYIEDRRPNANADPYVVSALVTKTICSALA